MKSLILMLLLVLVVLMHNVPLVSPAALRCEVANHWHPEVCETVSYKTLAWLGLKAR